MTCPSPWFGQVFTENNMKWLMLFISLTLFSACSTIVKGTDHGLSVVTDPAGAACVLERKGMIIGAVNPTPGNAQISKTKHDVHISCTKEGYDDAVGVISSNFEGWTLGNILIGGIIGLGVDAASGAMNEYDDQVIIILQKKGKEI